LTGGFRLGVFDTSVLTQDITAALKRGRPSSILDGMRHGTLRGFIPHYVWAEVPRVLADRKREGGTFDLVKAERLWWQQYVPLLHVVSVTGLPMTAAADKLAHEDLSDVGILQLADVLAPSSSSPPTPTSSATTSPPGIGARCGWYWAGSGKQSRASEAAPPRSSSPAAA
jgi:hypothetical protein